MCSNTPTPRLLRVHACALEVSSAWVAESPQLSVVARHPLPFFHL